jgi:hypothetical protein
MKAHSTMGKWKLKKLVKGSRASRATGKSKGIVASSLQKYMCRANRSWRHPLYDEIMGGGMFTRKGNKKAA